MPQPHPPEFRRRAVELARQLDDEGRRLRPMKELAAELGISESCLRNWIAQADIDEGHREPRLAELEREAAARGLAGTPTPTALTSADIEQILDELGGLGHVLSTAEPTEKAQVYASLGLRLRYQPDENRVVATADLGRVLSGVGGGT